MSTEYEPRTYDTKGKRADYGGRVDLLAECEGEWQGCVLSGNYVLDWKSSKEPQSKKGYSEWGMQTSGYRDGTEQEVHFDYEVHGNAVIRLDKFTGLPSVYDYSDTYERHREDFHALVRFYRSHKREYIAKGKVPSVTTILGIMAKPALIQWAANCSRDYILQELEKHQNEFIADGGLVNKRIEYDLVKKWAESAPKNFRKVGKQATDIGTDAHRFVEMDLKQDDMLAKVNWGHVNENTEKAFDAYLKFKRQVQLVPLQIEYKITGVVD
jgi:hypothetical protein